MQKLILLPLLCFVALCNCVFAQTTDADSANISRVSTNMANAYTKAIGQQSGLYNGPAFEPYNFRSNSSPNFKDTTAFINGTVNYDGVIYTNVPLIYNLNRDLVISRLYDDASSYCLLSERVSEFTLFNHHFIRVEADSLNKQMVTGFYDELYHNKLQLLARRTKNIQEKSSGLALTGNIFVQNNSYYLKKGNLYYTVNSQGRFFDVLKDKKNELKQYLKDNKINFGDNPEYAMQTLAAYYDHLTK